MILEFLNELSQAGLRIFTTQDAREIASSMGLKNTSINYVLKTLIAKKIIRSLFKGNYAIEDNLLSGSPLHKFEIATHLANNGAVCCWSAMAYHELTDQILSTIYLYSPQDFGKARSKYRYKIAGYDFHLIQISPNNLWGIERKIMGEIRFRVTDLERTLLDGLTYPQYCGGLREVLSAFEISHSRIDAEKLISYSKKTPLAVQKRLGWVLDTLALTGSENVKICESSHYDNLDPASPRRGKYNKKWMLVENF
jgi:predicted transcriptional regulator of viral defense system